MNEIKTNLAVSRKKGELGLAKTYRDNCRKQIEILQTALKTYQSEIEDCEDWLFLNEPRVVKMRFDFIDEEINDFEPMDSEPARWYLQPLDENGDDTYQPLQAHEEELLAKACGFEKIRKLYASLGIKDNQDASDFNGMMFKVTFLGNGKAKIEEEDE